MKHKGLYVDLDGKGKPISTPDEITEAEARLWLNHAAKAVARLPPEDAVQH